MDDGSVSGKIFREIFFRPWNDFFFFFKYHILNNFECFAVSISRCNDIAIRNVDQGKYVVYQKFSLFSRRNLLLERDRFEIEKRIFGI